MTGVGRVQQVFREHDVEANKCSVVVWDRRPIGQDPWKFFFAAR